MSITLPPEVVSHPRMAGFPRPAGIFGGPSCTLLTDPLFLGRDAALVDVLRRIRHGRHTLLVAGEGLGKTRLLMEVAAVAAGRRLLLDADAQHKARCTYASLPQDPEEAFTLVYVPEAGPAGCLVEALARGLCALGILALPDVPPELRAGACAEYGWEGTRKLLPTIETREKAILTGLHDLAAEGRAPRLLLVLDSLDRASASQGHFLTELQRRCTLLGACRQVSTQRALRTFFATFGHICLDPLPSHHMAAHFDYVVERYGVACADETHYAREVLRRAEGNPAILRAMLFDGAQSPRVSEQDVRDLQARDDAPYFNMGLVYVFALIGLAASRVLLTGVRNTDLYILLTFVTIIAYLVFQVFRPFFMWQPGPEGR